MFTPLRISVFLLVFSLRAMAQIDPPSPVTRAEYPDSVSAVVITGYDFKQKGSDTQLTRQVSRKELRFDRAGRLTAVLHYNEQGKIYFGYEHVYSADGRKYVDRDAVDTTDINIVRHYDRHGRILRESSFTAGRIETEFYYSSDSTLEKSTEFRHYGKDGAVDSRVDNEYGPNGLVTKSTYLKRFGKQYDTLEITWYRYDGHGRLLERKWSEPDRRVYFYNTYEYNEKGQLIREEYFASKSSANSEFWSETVFTYDEYGGLAESTQRSNNSIFSLKYTTTYNAGGLPVKCVVDTENGATMYVWSYYTRTGKD